MATDDEQGYHMQSLDRGAARGSAPRPASRLRDYQLVEPGSPPIKPASMNASSDELDNAQYVSYRDDRPRPLVPQRAPEEHYEEIEYKQWVPLPLRLWFWVTYVTILALGAVGLEVALYYAKKNHGWPVTSAFAAEQGFMHYVYTFPAVAVAMFITSMWAWTDFEIKKLQPYVDLTHGDATPQRSLLIDYTRYNNFTVWIGAARNRHYVVTLASLMVILTLCFSPLSGSLFTVRDTLLSEPSRTVGNLGALGLSQDVSVRDLTAFVTAAGYASAAVLYDVGDPPFVHDSYTIAPFELPVSNGNNATVYANTTAIKSDPNCNPADKMDMFKLPSGPNGEDWGWNNSGTFQGCNYTWHVDRLAENLFGVGVLNDTTCAAVNSTPPQFQPIVFWFFTYIKPPASSIAFCTPNISFWDVSVELDLASGNLTRVTPLGPMDVGKSNFSQFAGNMTGAPLYGRAYNGATFNASELVAGDIFVGMRESSTQLQLPAAVFQKAVLSEQGLRPSFDNGGSAFVQWSTQVYQMYLQVFAKSAYFLKMQDPLPMTVQVKSVQKRLWLSDAAVHLLAVALILLALFGTITHLLHRGERQDVRIGHAPGTIASAVSIGAQSSIGAVLAGRQREEDMQRALQNKKFRIDPRTNTIVMEGEEGYEDAKTPDPKQHSVFGMLQKGLHPSSPHRRRFSTRIPASPMSPMTPRTPGTGTRFGKETP